MNFDWRPTSIVYDWVISGVFNLYFSGCWKIAVVVVEFVGKEGRERWKERGLPFIELAAPRCVSSCGAQKPVTIAQPRAAAICGCGNHAPPASCTNRKVITQGPLPYLLASLTPHQISKFTDFRSEDILSISW